MKKLFTLSIILLAVCTALRAQDQVDIPDNTTVSESYGQFNVIPVLEGVTYFEDSDPGSYWGRSGLYTNFQGKAGKHFGWTLTNMWMSNDDPLNIFWVYKALGHSDMSNWLMLCNIDLTFGRWNFNIGKNYISSGGFESDDWDWDIRDPFYSPYWGGIAAYQWGLKVSYTTKSEMSEFTLHATTSPWGERPFKSNLWTYSGMWKGNYGWFSNIWSVSALETPMHTFDVIVALGQRATFDDWTITIDYMNNAGITEIPDYEDCYHAQKGHTLLGTVTYAFQDRFDVSLKGSYSSYEKFNDKCGWYCGAVINWYPLKDSQDLRLHALAGYESFLGGPVVNLGATYNIPIRLWGNAPEE